MGVISGSATFRHYRIPRVALESEAIDREGIWERMRYRRFAPIPPESIDTRRAGWCALNNPYNLEFTEADVFREWGYLIGMRVDTYRVPSAMVKDRLKRKTKEWLAINYPGKDPDSVRIEKDTLRAWKEEVIALIRIEGEVVPSTSYCDVVIDFRKGDAFVFSHSKSADECFFQLFGLTFPDYPIIDSNYLLVADHLIAKAGANESAMVDLNDRLKALGRPEALTRD